jgi:hypothetical protein
MGNYAYNNMLQNWIKGMKKRLALTVDVQLTYCTLDGSQTIHQHANETNEIFMKRVKFLENE